MKKILTTVLADLEPLRGHLQEWADRVEVLDRRALSGRDMLRRLVVDAPRYDAVLLNGSGRLDQVAATLLRRRPQRPPVVISDATWGVGTRPLDRLACRLGLRAIDSDRTTYCVLSSDEVILFPRTWGVDPSRVVFTPFCYTLTDSELTLPSSATGGVFAGGDSMRDYRPLVAAASRVDVPMTLATSSLSSGSASALPPNVRAGTVPHDSFVKLLRAATVVVVPLQGGTERSAGQQTYLNAMALAKPVVVTDAPGVRDYIEDGVTGLIVPPGNTEAMAEALRTALDPANGQLGTQAQEAVLAHFSPRRHVAALLDVVERAASSARQDASPGGQRSPLPLPAAAEQD